MNQIPKLQNEEPQLVLMRARSQTYRRAQTLVLLQFVVAVVAPVVAGAVALLAPAVRPHIALVSLLLTLVDVTALDRLQRQHLKLAAKISEAFDCAVLALPWNPFAAGKPPGHETVAEAAAAWRGGDAKLIDWYPIVVGRAPLHTARIICQRTNLWYDATLRRHYGRRVLAIAALLLVGLLVAAVLIGLTVEVFISAVLAPAAPVLIWALRESYRHRDTAEAQETAKSDVEALWARVKSGTCDEVECTQLSREFQNLIYMRRGNSPLMMPGIYGAKRANMESQMNKGAAAYLAEIGL